MLTELCKELRNWFDYNQPRLHGAFTIENGKITDQEFLDAIKTNQYFRIVGSVFNDGVYKYTNDLELTDELFVGAVWLMAIPKEVVALSDEIDEWIGKNANIINSPYQSESFGGYSYSKATSADGGLTWQSFFANRLNKWRKI